MGAAGAEAAAEAEGPVGTATSCGQAAGESLEIVLKLATFVCRADAPCGSACRLDPETEASAVPYPRPVRVGPAGWPRRCQFRLRGVTVHLVVDVDVGIPRRRPTLGRNSAGVRQNHFSPNNGSATSA